MKIMINKICADSVFSRVLYKNYKIKLSFISGFLKIIGIFTFFCQQTGTAAAVDLNNRYSVKIVNKFMIDVIMF